MQQICLKYQQKNNKKNIYQLRDLMLFSFKNRRLYIKLSISIYLTGKVQRNFKIKEIMYLNNKKYILSFVALEF